jgi:hypothetical protein
MTSPDEINISINIPGCRFGAKTYPHLFRHLDIATVASSKLITGQVQSQLAKIRTAIHDGGAFHLFESIDYLAPEDSLVPARRFALQVLEILGEIVADPADGHRYLAAQDSGEGVYAKASARRAVEAKARRAVEDRVQEAVAQDRAAVQEAVALAVSKALTLTLADDHSPKSSLTPYSAIDQRQIGS